MANLQRRDKSQPAGERYTHGYSDANVLLHASRSAEDSAFFLLPHLKPGMRVIDCGSGPGSITMGLAQAVAPGEAVGIEVNPHLVATARSTAAEAGVSNVTFEAATIYELPFPDASFDAAFAHTVLQHLKDPLRALEEMRRVLKPGGVVGVREEDGGWFWYPDDQASRESRDLYYRVWQRNGGDPYVARRHKSLLRQAGFSRIEAGAIAVTQASHESTQAFGETLAGVILDPQYVSAVLEYGWADRETLEAHSKAWRDWGAHPDAIISMTHCHAVGWND